MTIAKVLGRYVGEITVIDRVDGISTIAAVLSRNLGVAGGFITGTAAGFSGQKPYSLAFAV